MYALFSESRQKRKLKDKSEKIGNAREHLEEIQSILLFPGSTTQTSCLRSPHAVNDSLRAQ